MSKTREYKLNLNEVKSGAPDYRLLIMCIILSLRVGCFEYENTCVFVLKGLRLIVSLGAKCT